MISTILSLFAATLVSTVYSDIPCFLKLVRFIAPTNSYRLLCKCPLSLMDPVEPSRGVANTFAIPPFTNGNNLAVRRCISKQSSSLLNICNNRQKLFSSQSQSVLNHCVNAPMLPVERKDKRQLQFNTNKCAPTFFRRNVTGAQKGIWSCQCDQGDNYFVGTGDAQVEIDGEGEDAEKEWQMFGQCVAMIGGGVERVCEETPKDFGVLALHLLQVCCKRQRVGMNSKFACRAIVPDDLDALKKRL